MTKLIALLSFLAVSAFAADTNVQTDKLKLGRPGAATDKILEFNRGLGTSNPKIRANNSTGKIEFSNDGTLFKGVGSGGGGGSGINLLADNPGFEAGVLQSMSASAPSTVTAIVGSNALFETASAQFLPTIAAQTYETQAYAIQKGLQGGACLASIYYTSAESVNLVTATILDGSNVAKSQVIPFTRNVGAATPLYVPFTCPTSGTVKIRMTSTGSASALVLDNMHLGSETRLKEVSQAQVVTTITYPQQSSSSVPNTMSLAYTTLNSGPGAVPTVVGGCTVTTGSTEFTCPNLAPGHYTAEWNGRLYCAGVAGASGTFQLTDGTNTGGTGQSNLSSAQVGGAYVQPEANHLSLDVEYNNAGTHIFSLQAYTNGSGAICATLINSNNAAQFTLKKFPSGSQTITSNSGQAASWSGYFPNSIYWTTTSGAFADPTYSGSGALVERSNQNFGTVTGYPGFLPGIAFSPPKMGRYMVCVKSKAGNTGAPTYGSEMQLVDQNLNELGTDDSYTTQLVLSSVGVCGIMTVNSLASQSVRVRLAAGGGSTSYLGFGLANALQFSIFQLDAGQAAVAFPTLVTSPIQQKLKMVAYTYSSTQIGMFQSGHPSVGVFDHDISAGAFTIPPVCTALISDVGGTVGVAMMGNVSTSAAQVRTFFGGGLLDVAYHVMCIGY